MSPSFLLFLFLLYYLLLIFQSSEADDGQVLLKLANSISPLPGSWSNTSSAKSCTRWIGVACDSDNRVTHLSISGLNVSGSLPPELSSLSYLITFYADGNRLSGKIPSFANHSRLEYLYLDSNNFTSIPQDFLLGLPNLSELRISNNLNLPQWQLPLHLSHSRNLVSISAVQTNLFGAIPDIFGSLPDFTLLDLRYNNLTGPIPLSLQKCTISYLYLNNQDSGLTGGLTVLATMRELQVVDLSNNKLQGPIPDLSDLQDLYLLKLSDNELTGLVPPSFSSYHSLGEITLSNNKLQGPVPMFPNRIITDVKNGKNNFCAPLGTSCDQQVTTLLQVAGAVGYPGILSGVWQGNDACHDWEFIGCDGRGNVESVNLSRQGFAGSISPAFANLSHLKYLYLNNNNLTGPIPEGLTHLSSLTVVDVSNNNLSGEVPQFTGSVNVITAPGNSLLRPETSREPVLHKLSVVVISAVVTIAATSLASTILICFLIVRGKTADTKDIEALIQFHHSQITKRFSYRDVKKITKSFAEKLGQGGSGAVYKGELEGRNVAVKVLSKSKIRGGEEFINEVASMSSTSHVNIVALLGFSYNQRHKSAALIYEYMPNGSLDKFIHGSHAKQHSLGWKTLYDIAIGIARGLEYLHRGCTRKIVHLDIKPHNILLDQEFRPKISDFGLAKRCRSEESKVSMMGARGTAGYIAPEIVCRNLGEVSSKADVYSYGMMVLEMAGGRKNVDVGVSRSSKTFFPEWISNHFEVLEEVCGTSDGVSDEEEEGMARKMILVGLWCVQTCPSDRPSMTRAVEMLEGGLQFLQIPPKPFTYPDQPSPNHQHQNPISVSSS